MGSPKRAVVIGSVALLGSLVCVGLLVGSAVLIAAYRPSFAEPLAIPTAGQATYAPMATTPATAIPPTATAVPSLTLTASPTQTPVPVNPVPIITEVETFSDRTLDFLRFSTNVTFQDGDGDANVVDWELVSSTDPTAFVNDGATSASASQQRAGTVVTGIWNCGVPSTSVVRITIVDKAGNRSNSVEATYVCSDAAATASP